MATDQKTLWIAGLVAVTALGSLFASWTVGGTEVVADFREHAVPESIRLKGPQVDRLTAAEADGLRIKLPKDRPNRGPVGFALPIELRGDFEATATFEIFKAEAPDKGYGVGVTMGVDERARVGRYVRPKGAEVVVWDFWPVVEGARRMQSGARPCEARELRIRLRRTGTVLHFQWSPDSAGEEFQEVHNIEYGAVDTKVFTFLAESAGEPCALDVRVVELHVRGGSQAASIFQAFAGAAAAVAGGFLLWKWVRANTRVPEVKTCEP
jgi:hypothetical protein